MATKKNRLPKSTVVKGLKRIHSQLEDKWLKHERHRGRYSPEYREQLKGADAVVTRQKKMDAEDKVAKSKPTVSKSPPKKSSNDNWW